jgi:glycosyltransferase involved in cell wall biosynthesis
VLHIHAIGPAIVTPLARLLGLTVVVTHHGPDYERDKWGQFPRWVLRTGERAGMRFARARIAISRSIQELIRTKYQRDSDLIPNGSVPVSWPRDTQEIERFGLERGRYFLQVSRIVPEKRQLDLIEAFRLARPQGWKLVLVGGTGTDRYSREVIEAGREAGVVLAGFQRGAALAQLYAHAGVFVLPSSHEGLPIAILEALSYGLPVVASEIPANREINLGADSYFPVGDIPALARRLTAAAQTPQTDTARDARRRWVAETYDWDRIARQTYALYHRVLGLKSPAALEQEGHQA